MVRQEKIQLNHYAVRSQEDFKAKHERGTGDGAGRSSRVYWNKVEGYATDRCTEGVEAGEWCFGSIPRKNRHRQEARKDSKESKGREAEAASLASVSDS